MFPYGPDFTLVLVASILFDIALVVCLLFIPVRRGGAPHRVTLAQCLIAATFVVIAWPFKCVLGHYVGVGFFGWMAMATFTAAVAAPTLGILALTIPRFRSRLTRGAKAFAGASLVAIPMFIWCSFIEPSRIVFEQTAVPVAGVKDPITIVVLADIQCSRITARERRIAEHVSALNPDIILMPGDLWQQRGTLTPEGLDLASPIAQEFRDFLRSLRASHGIFFSPGDCEEHYDWRGLIEGTGAQILDNAISRVNVRGRDVVIGGTALNWGSIYAQRTIDALEQHADNGSIDILMSHRPDLILLDSVPGFHDFGAIDLIVSGHTHGGQVVVPGIGPLVTFSNVPSEIGAGGLHALDADTWIYVSRGIGIERIQAPRVRFLCPPEVAVITIKDPAAN